jgi:hypothetical protein
VRVFLNVALTAGDLAVGVGPDALVAVATVLIAVAIALTAAKGIHRARPGTVVAPVDQVGIIARNLPRIDAIIRVLALGGAAAAPDRIVGRVLVPLQADQIAGTVVAGVAVALTTAHRILVAMVVLVIVIVKVLVDLRIMAVTVANVFQLWHAGGYRYRTGCGTGGRNRLWARRRNRLRARHRHWRRRRLVAIVNVLDRDALAAGHRVRLGTSAVETLETFVAACSQKDNGSLGIPNQHRVDSSWTNETIIP